MLSDITIGQYFPGDSVLHRMDARVKIVLTIALLVALFLPQNWAGLGVAVAFLVFVILLSKLPPKLILKSLKPILPIVLITALLNIFYVSTGQVLWRWWVLRITTDGLTSAGFLTVRILCLIAGSSLLTYTTGPTTLTAALERLLKPLKLLRVPVHDLAMMMSIALRFIPTLIEETDKLMAAQKARGADLESGNLAQRIKALLPILIPLFASSLRRAIELAMAMECRCYHGGDGRTRMTAMHMAFRDWMAILTMSALIAGIVALNIWL